jgi:tetratricopeptide (TPR) repeat protein
LLEQAVQTARSHHGSDSNTLINALGLLSWTIARKGDIREALELHRQRHAIIAAREPRESLRRIRSAMWLVTYMSWLGRSQEALPVIDELMAIPEDVTASESMRNLRKEQAFDLRATLSSSLANLGRLDEARAVALALLRDYENFEPEDPEMLIHAQSLFVRATRRLGRANEVEELAERMAESARREPRADHKLSYIGELAAVKLALGKLPETLVLADEAIYVQTRTSWLPAEARVRKIRGETLLKLGRVKEASAQLEEVDAYWRDFDPDHPRAAEAAWWFGQALVAAGDSRRGNAVLAEARPRLGVSWLPELRPLATAPAPNQAPAPANLARD